MPSLLRRKSKAKNGDSNITPIPEPPALPWLGHIAEFKSEDSLQDLTRLHEIYGNYARLYA